MLYLAIDQHRKQLTTRTLDESGELVQARQVSTEWSKVRAFFESLRERAQSEGFVTIVEVCGFNDWLLKMIQEYGCQQIVVIQPERKSKHKTDRRDAKALAELLWLNRSRLLTGQRVHMIRRIRPASPSDAYARQITNLRYRLSRQLTMTINRVHHILLKHNLQQECPTKGLQTNRGLQWLKSLTLPPIDRFELDGLLAQWQLFEEQLEMVTRQIVETVGQFPAAKLLMSIPGMGAYSSLAVACRIGDIRHFPRPDSLANFWGLTPGCNNSGDNTQRLGAITKQGSCLVRFLLGQLVMHVLRRDAFLRRWYRRIKQRRGSKIARVAVMRRLAMIIWHMVKHNEVYNYGGPRKTMNIA